MKVEIIAPDKRIYDGEAKYVGVPGLSGSLGILDNHAPLITTLKSGGVILKKEDGSEETFDVAGGVIEVLNNRVIILAE